MCSEELTPCYLIIGTSSYCTIAHNSPSILAEGVSHEALIGEELMGASPGDGILMNADMSDTNSRGPAASMEENYALRNQSD